MKFNLIKLSPFIDVWPTVGDYQVVDQIKAKQMVAASVERIKELTLFGYGFPLNRWYRDYPANVVTNKYLVNYDAMKDIDDV